MRYYKIPVERVLVAYDELDLPAGRVQLKHGGGTAGHNGATSVVEHIGPDFWRLRVGVGHPRDTAGARRDVVDHVLTRAAAEEEAHIREALRAAADILPLLLEHGAERAMNRLHQRKRPPKPEAPPDGAP
jgi:PTH1 family peptidyl-tRNA hydrolase